MIRSNVLKRALQAQRRENLEAMKGALKLLQECRSNLRKAASIVSLGAYRDILTSIAESELALKRAQVALRDARKATNELQEQRHNDE